MGSKEKAEKKALLQKEKLQATPLVKTIKNLTEVRVEDLKIYQKVKSTEKQDLIFLLILPIPLWPAYFLFRIKIKQSINKMMFFSSNNNASKTRKDILEEYTWIKKVISSSESSDHLNSCRNLINNWSVTTSNKIRECKCTFYKTSEITKTIETYTRAKKELNLLMANKKVEIRGELITL